MRTTTETNKKVHRLEEFSCSALQRSSAVYRKTMVKLFAKDTPLKIAARRSYYAIAQRLKDFAAEDELAEAGRLATESGHLATAMMLMQGA